MSADFMHGADSEERRNHEVWIQGFSRAVLERMHRDLAKPPPAEEWYVKRWWRLRRDAVSEALDDLDTAPRGG